MDAQALKILNFFGGLFQMSLAYHWIGWIAFHVLDLEHSGAFICSFGLAASIAVVYC